MFWIFSIGLKQKIHFNIRDDWIVRHSLSKVLLKGTGIMQNP